MKATQRLNATRQPRKFVRNTGKDQDTTRFGLMIRPPAEMSPMMCVRMCRSKQKFLIVRTCRKITVSMFRSLTAKMYQKRCARCSNPRLVKMFLRKFAKFSTTRFLSGSASQFLKRFAMEGSKNQFHKLLEALVGMVVVLVLVLVLGPDGLLEQSELGQELTLMLWCLEIRGKFKMKYHIR